MTGGQQLFINRALPVLRRDARVLGVALGGSYGNREAMDEFSGLDFVVAVNPADMDDVRASMGELAALLGPLLACFPAVHIHMPDLLICMYDDPIIHVDLDFVPADAVLARADQLVVLHERDGAMTALADAAATARFGATVRVAADASLLWHDCVRF
ncbi:MAG: hypothetical protein LBC65_06390 [Oscillospiraceae bacterium]|jgi:hypothetical protein|nr:hypothetical protein [Oscillospiraceae bacterium]